MQTRNQNQPLPPHVVEIARIPDQGPGDLHPQHQEVAYVAELTAIRDSIRHFLPPRAYAATRTGADLFLEGIEAARANYRQALEVLTEETARAKSSLLQTTAAWFPGDHRTPSSYEESVSFREARDQWDRYDASLMRFVQRVPALQRLPAVYNDDLRQRFPTYAPMDVQGGLRERAFSYYSHLVSACRQALNERAELSPEDGGVDSMLESLKLLPRQDLLEALHGMYEQESRVLAPRFAGLQEAEEQAQLRDSFFTRLPGHTPFEEVVEEEEEERRFR